MERWKYRQAQALACCLVLAGCGNVGSDRVEWTTMGTVAALQTRGAGDASKVKALVEETKSVFGGVELRLNAHCPTSDVSRLAALPQADVLRLCAAADRPCYEAAFKLMEASGGAFNPRWRGPGTLDLGAIAKGFAADLAADVACAGGIDALVDLGGNLKAARSSSRPWRTGVKDPSGNGFAAVVELRGGEALATSATYFRGSHIFDGRTGRAVTNGVASVTVLCESAMWADGLSTTLFVLGPEEGRAFLAHMTGSGQVPGGAPAALWILDDGRQVKHDPNCRFRH
ncbi:MAG: FAD:protein FMN transferase [Kiritimatiellae bacterium]|nr:FAD:protein FMN transferase [Kiritimatiellia bacterium]